MLLKTLLNKTQFYPDRIPDWFSKWFTSYYWHGDREKNSVFLTFDDGPTPEVTDFVIQQLSRYGFKGTFFCIGDKVNRHPNIYDQLKEEGHRIGNHTHNHLSAWDTDKKQYLNNVLDCSKLITSKLFRPPYGHITNNTTKVLLQEGFKIVLWDVLSGDFDTKRSASSCLKNLKKNTKEGSVIVFHDSDKSFEKLQEILPKYLRFLKEKGWTSEVIN